MRVVTVDHNGPAYIGIYYAGENDATQVSISLAYFKATYGAGTAQVLIQRPQDDAPYPVATDSGEDAVTWTVSNTDTDFTAPGYGRMQVIYTAGETIAKSRVYFLRLERSLGSPGETPPPGAGWVEQTLEAAARAEAAADKAEQLVGGINLPDLTPEDAGKVVLVNPEGTGYTLGTLSGSGGGYEIGHGLKLANNVLSVDTAAAVEQDNTLPITAAAVYTTVGNIEILLQTI